MAEENPTKLTIGELPWPVLVVSEGRAIAAANTEAARLLGMSTVNEQALTEHFDIGDAVGKRLGVGERAWEAVTDGRPFARREQWVDRRTGARLSLRVYGFQTGGGHLLVLQDESQEPATIGTAQTVARVTTALLQSPDAASAARAVVEQVQSISAADAVLLMRTERDGEHLALVASRGLPDSFVDQRLEVSLEEPLLVVVAARTRTLQELPELDALLPGEMPITRGLLQLGIHSLLAIPLVAAAELIGVLAIARRQPGRRSASERQELQALASACAVGLQRARAHDADRRAFVLLHSLQDAVVAVQSGRPHEENLRWLLNEARALTGSRYAAMGVRDPRTGQLSAFLQSGMPEDALRRMTHPPEGRGLLGAVLAERRPIRVREVRRDPRSCGVPEGHPEMTTFLGVPIFVGGEVFGNFYLCDKEDGREYSADDEQLMRLLAAQAALMLAYSKQVRVNDEQRRMLEALLREAPDGILFFEAAEGRLLIANAAAERIFGRPLEGPQAPERFEDWGISLPDGQRFDPERLPSRRALQGEVAREEATIQRPDGHRVDVSLSGAPVTVGDRALGAVVVVQDISAYKDLVRLREELAAVVAHDLRNPIQALLLGIDTLLRRAVEGVVTVPVPRLERMQHTAVRLARMVGDLLETSRVELGRIRIETRLVSPARAVGDLVNNIRPTLGVHELRLSIVGDPPSVLADPYRLDQILTNLLENAARYSPDGAPIEVTLRAVQGGAEVTVRDEGAGMAPEDLPRIFDRYYQTQRARRQRTGMGLGLYITRSLVEAQGGRIWVDSTLGKGSTFHVWLPAAPSAPSIEAPAP